MKLLLPSRYATVGIALSAIVFCSVVFLSSRAAFAQTVFAPFTPPPSAPGTSWPPETLEKLKLYESSLERAAKARNGKSYGVIAAGIGALHASVSDYAVAVEYYKRGLDAATMVNDKDTQAVISSNMGMAYFRLGRMEEATASLIRALNLQAELLSSQPTPDAAKRLQQNEASILLNLGTLYGAQQQYSKALDSLNRALPLTQATGDLAAQAHVTGGLGLVYLNMGDVQKAFGLLQQSVTLSEQNHDMKGEASALINMAAANVTLGEYEDALQSFQRALPLKRELHDRAGEATALIDIGVISGKRGDEQKALTFYTQALAICRELGDKDHQAAALTRIGDATGKLGDKEKALTYYAQALPLARQVNNHEREAEVLVKTGLTYADMGYHQKALDTYRQALPIVTSLGNPRYLADTFYALLLACKDDQPALAIFYGKQAVDSLQRVRENIAGMGGDVQAGFLASQGIDERPLTEYYHSLADLLIGQGRVAEAQQVLDLLKLQEYKDYARDVKPVSATVAAAPTTPTFTQTESKAEEQYHKSADHLVTLGAQWEALKKITPRTVDQEREFQQLSDQLAQASKEMNDYYQRIYALLGKGNSANREVAEVKGNVAVLKQQLAHLPRTIALYTIVGKEHYSVIVITSATTIVREFPIGEDDLNKKIVGFTKILRLPEADPKPQAAELYRILVGPIADDLDQAHASTLMWVLDGKLRYLPMSALYDGKQYLVQRYNSVNISPVSIAHLSDKPDMKRMSVLAMGISKKYEGLDALPNVKTEMNSIVKNPLAKSGTGALPGNVLLDEEFTVKAMENELSGRHPIVHIASHFVLSPGDDSRSYLLLAGKEQSGTGYHLSVADFRDDQRLALDDTELLTLSACATGIGGASDGREVDGLATTAQLKGAKSVIASLWSVNDMSTADLMADFYHRWAAGNGSVAKAEALRQAQIDLLLGKQTPKAKLPNAQDFSRPYYWAPFVLMGNWQ